jgi:hypothetical protein
VIEEVVSMGDETMLEKLVHCASMDIGERLESREWTQLSEDKLK